MCRRDRPSSYHLLAAGFGVFVLGCGGSAAAPSTPKQDCRGARVWHEDDAARLVGCRRIEGNLELGGALKTSEALTGIEHVAGDLVVGPSYQLGNLASLGSVVRVDGELRVEGNWLLQGLFLSKLESVGGSISVKDNSGLVACVLPRLRSFAGLEVAGNRSLERLDLSGLGEEGVSGQVEGRALEEVLAPARIEWQAKPPAETPTKGS